MKILIKLFFYMVFILIKVINVCT